MTNLIFKPLVTILTVSSKMKRIDTENTNLISKTYSSIEFGKVISYKNRGKNERYRREL